MSHGKGKVVGKKVKLKKTTPPKSRPLAKGEGQYFQELVEISNRYSTLMQQKTQYEFIITKLQENRKKIQDNVVKMPVTITLIPNIMFYQEHDKKKVFKFFDEQIVSYKNTIKSLEGQLIHRYEDYVECAVRVREFLVRRYGNLKGKQIVPDRKSVEDEENLFEAEFQKLIDDPETMKEFKKAKKEAVKQNTQRAIKKVK